MADTRITQLDPSTGIADSDEIPSAKGSSDFKFTGQQMADYVISKIDSADILDAIDNGSNPVPGLDAEFLSGLTSAFYRNASNLNAGTVSNSRLPVGEFNTSFTTGGAFGTGNLKASWKLPEFLGERIMLQMGHTFFIPADTNMSETFYEPFVSGINSSVNEPLIITSQENRRDNWNGTVADTRGWPNIELAMNLWYKDLNGFRASSRRRAGSNTDYVRIQYLAIGKY